MRNNNLISFNKPYLTGNESGYILEAMQSGKIAGDGMFTKKCHDFFEKRYGFKKVLLTTSCTDALEMAAILIDIQEGDEVIMPSYTFVSTANAFVLRGAKIVFADSNKNYPNLDAEQIEKLITSKTKAIVPVHYAGAVFDMDKIMQLAAKYNLYVIEDAAQAIDSYYMNKPAGSIGHLSAFSFHETKNLISGEGGMLVINDEKFIERAEIIREKGTNRSKFFRGEIDKYGWVDIGSSFLPADIIAAFLYAQCEQIDIIHNKRKMLWQTYYDNLLPLSDQGLIELPFLHENTIHNAHTFYIVFSNEAQRNEVIKKLKSENIQTVFHYLSLHKSVYYRDKHDGRILPNSDRFTDCLLRLPIYFELTDEDVKRVCEKLSETLSG